MKIKHCRHCGNELSQFEKQVEQCLSCDTEIESDFPLKGCLIYVAILLILLFVAVISKAQCEPDKTFYPSATMELTTDWGFILQGGVTGQTIPLSIHAGIRVREFMANAAREVPYKQAKLIGRLEIGWRIVNGLHVSGGLTMQNNDISITGYKRIGDQVAIYGRALYDGMLTFGMGVKFVFYRE